MRICFVCNGIPSERYPLIGIFEFDQARELVKKGEEVAYFAIDMRSIRHKRKWGVNTYNRDGVKVVEYNLPLGRIPLAIRALVGSLMVKKLYGITYKEHSPDLFHAHFTMMGVIASSIAKKTMKPLVLTEHSSLMNNENVDTDVLKFAERAYSEADKVIAVSSALSKKIKKHTGIDSIIVPNMLSEECFFLSTKEKHNGIGFITTCNLIPHKRLEQLLRVFIEIADENKDIYLGIIGDGELRNRLVKISNDSNVGDRIKFYGLQSRSSIAEIYKQYDCFVLPSMRETYGVSFIEAMATGLPVISTLCGGPEDFVNEENGILIPVDDKEALKNAMKTMCKNIGLYDALKIKNYVKDRFSGNVVADELCDVYKEVLWK